MHQNKYSKNTVSHANIKVKQNETWITPKDRHLFITTIETK
jgi:hypothetical protein